MNTTLLYISLFIFLLICVYFLMPELFLHFLGIGSHKRQFSPGVSFTFDDGPDPRYTPRLLEILARQKIKACFFLVGEKVEKYPALVKQIRDEGHIIGCHNYIHRHAWLLSPWTSWKLWDKGIESIKNITGQEPEYIRPPWGGCNLVLYFWSLSRGKKIVVWNAHGFDWQAKRMPHQIADRIVKRAQEGTIILLHDSGGEPGAPENTLACLDELCARIRKDRKLPIVPLSFPNWSWRRKLVFRIWEKWEHLYAKIFDIKRIDDNNLFRLCLTRYNGPDLIEEDKVVATKGDIVGEIHFDNIRFQAVGTDSQKTSLRAIKLARRSFPALINYISTHPEHQNIKVYLGITMINRGVKPFGFNVQEYPNRGGQLIGWLQKIIMRIYHPSDQARKTASLGQRPKIVWISKKALLERYTLNKQQQTERHNHHTRD
jgi:peptidoglycan/xylan/chitin deacetylase (PgdA/CDA1 family)